MKKNLFCILLSIALVLGMTPAFSLRSQAAEGIRISSTNFPDAKFRAFVKTYDTDGNGYLTVAERNAVETMDASNKGISNLKGIERFKALNTLYCSGNKLKALDVTRNTSLLNLNCSNNDLEELYLNPQIEVIDCSNNDLSGLELVYDGYRCEDLRALYCENNWILSLDVNSCPQIEELYCDNNDLTNLYVNKAVYLRELSFSNNRVSNYGNGIDIQKLTELEILYCDNNKPLKKLDVTSNKKLTVLDCSNTSLKTLDVSNNTKLIALGCSNNALTSLDVSNLTALQQLYCANNKIASLTVTKNTGLQILDCGGNKLTKLNLTKNNDLLTLYCNSNSLSALSVSNLTSLQYLDCSDNELSSIDVTANTGLVAFGCANTGLSTLDVRKNTKLQTLAVNGNQLSSLNVTKNTKLVSLYCGSNQLTTLNLAYNTALQQLYCEENQLTKLDVSKNTKLAILSCSGNQLTTLDLGSNAELQALEAKENALTSIQITNCPKLLALTLSSNKLKTLDLTGNPLLMSLLCDDNKLTSLNIKNNPDLQILTCQKNQITSLGIGNNEKLITAYDSSYVEEDGAIYYYKNFYDQQSGQLIDEYLLAVDSGTKVTGRKPAIVVQPKSQTVAYEDYVTFTAEGSGGDLTYQWYYRASADEAWTKVSSDAGKESEYTFKTKARHDGYQYRCKVSNSKGYVYTKTVTLYVAVKSPKILTQPSSQTVLTGETASFTVEASGDYLEYQWYYRTGEWGSWTKVSSAAGKTATLTLTAQERHDGYEYKCMISNPMRTVETKLCKLGVAYAKPSITGQEERDTVIVGGTAYFWVGATGGGLSYQWYYRTSASGSWKAVSAASGKTKQFEIEPEDRHHGYQYRCKVTNLQGSVYSQVRTLTVVTAAPELVTQPEDQVVPEGTTAAFTTTADGRGLSYQWFYRTPGSDQWTAVASDNGMKASYSLTARARHNGYQYYCVVRNLLGTVTTDIRTLTVVSSAPGITSQPVDKTVQEGEKASFSVMASGEALSYQWYYRKSETGEWAEVTAASGKTASFSLTARARHNGYQYRCVVTNLMGSAETDVVTLTVH